MGLRRFAGIFVLAALTMTAVAQDAAPALVREDSATVPETVQDKPLPDLTKLLERAKVTSDAMQELTKSYTCKEVVVADEFDSHGNRKGSHTNEYQVFFVEKHEIHQHVARDGKPLSESDKKKEQERVDKLIADIKAHKVKDRDGIQLSALIKLATASEPRREMLNGRPTIFFHYKGNPNAQAHGIVEEVMKKLEGTIALDEQEAAIVHLDGTLQENFHVMGGFLVNVKKGSRFSRDASRINNEVWFTTDLKYHGDGKILLFKGFDGDGSIKFSDYRKMRTSVTLLPGSQVIGEDGKPIPNLTVEPQPAVPASVPKPVTPQK